MYNAAETVNLAWQQHAARGPHAAIEKIFSGPGEIGSTVPGGLKDYLSELIKLINSGDKTTLFSSYLFSLFLNFSSYRKHV
jgi:hypothetical protein